MLLHSWDSNALRKNEISTLIGIWVIFYGGSDHEMSITYRRFYRRDIGILSGS